MPKHIVRLLLLLLAFAAAAIGAKSFFTVDSFYRFGHYRADSVPEIAALTPVFQTPKACVECHAARHAEWSGGLHKTVICEVCHGALPRHPQSLRATIPTATGPLCTQCHEQMPGRPATVRQIVPAAHYPGAVQCIACHNPHTPKIAPVAPASAADYRAAQSAAAACAGCHGAGGQSVSDVWPNLAGQNAAYLARALGAFKTGTRNEPTMAPMAQTVADGDVQKLAAYFSSLPCRGPVGGHGSGDPAAGRRLAATCAACHGQDGHPVNTAWPALAGQNATYLATALGAFRDGRRNNPFMSPVAKGLSDADIANLASHYAALPCGGTKQGWVSR